ncbi:ribosomal protein L11 methyltransferase [Niabella ginsenosidivorans]|uniref:Ribosomal protein L11 methyltransferase n=1 Tax=Niabella ginsenosidivorans TaxID=1176587 RepID=A0A1A9I2Q1_9BACT|nr:50S ribosomal protein L11 methyltransferase [Niabella ginsenosidivorans]ANH81937.1 ribosomal protein L11 methyltransferase [Niabella ginsenosidivorans]
MQQSEKYIEVIFKNISGETAEKIIASLAEEADGFEEDADGLKAFFSSSTITTEKLHDLIQQQALPYELHELEAQNWNAVWESNFEPVVVADFVAVRASFHPANKQVQHEILINPKMSFGTGHHATTWLMLQQMQAISFKNKNVFDFGTGTGILAILATQLGAAGVLATDLDEWSITNARENFDINNCREIRLLQSDSAGQGGHFDVILANINKNVLLPALPRLKEQLNPGGILLLSGILAEDEEDMVRCAAEAGLILTNKVLKNNWLCIRLSV